MSVSVVEANAYKIPFRDALTPSLLLRQVWTPEFWYQSPPALAESLGFARIDDMPTRRGVWHRFLRSGLAIPDFPEGSTTINALLAEYEGPRQRVRVVDTDFQTTYPVLRVSANPLPLSEISSDLESMANHYLERPLLFGFPSMVLTGPYSAALTGMFGGIITGAGISAGYYLMSGNLPAALALGAVSFATGTGIVAGAAVNVLSESRAKRSISSMGEYFGGHEAVSVLLGLISHIRKVEMQRELYAEVQGLVEGPEDFLKLYAEMPGSLIALREREIGAPDMREEALERMVAIVHALREPPKQAVPLLS